MQLTKSDRMRRHLTEARRWLEKATLRNPQEGKYWYNRAWVEDELGGYRQAVISLNRAIEVSPQRVEAYYNLACALCNIAATEGPVADREALLARALEALDKVPTGSRVWEIAQEDKDLSILRTDPQMGEKFRELVRRR